MKRFNRFELKYVIAASTWPAVRNDVLAQMDPDSNGADGSYPVASVYYDTPDLAFHRAKREGIKFRRKLRVRRYGSDTEAPVYVEIKQRINRTTQKRRLSLPLADAYRLCGGDPVASVEEATDVEAANEVQFLVRALSLQPTCIVGYQREAYVGGPYESGLRITFDHGLWAGIADDGLDPEVERHPMLPAAAAILEVKANDRVPIWLANLLARHECALRRYSKYCKAVDTLAAASLLRAPELSGAR